MKFTKRVFAVATAAFFVVGLGLGLSPSQADDQGPVIAGTFHLTIKVPSPGGDSMFAKPGTRTYYFGAGCAVGSACKITRTTQSGKDTRTPLTAGGGGFSFRIDDALDCFDTATGALSTKHGADYTFTGRLRPSAFEVRDGVRYATALSGSYDEVVRINAKGRATTCTDNGKLVRKQHSVLTGTVVPLALPAPAAGAGSTAPLGIAPAATTTTGQVPAFRLPQTDQQKASALAVAQGRRSSVPGALMVPADAVKNIGPRLGKDLLLVALLGLLMVFPAQLFNSTYEENHERVDRVLAKARLRRPRPGTAGFVIPAQRSESGPDPDQPPVQDLVADQSAAQSATQGPAVEEATHEQVAVAIPRRTTRLAVFLACALVGTVLGGLLDPKLSFDTTWYALLVGVFAAVLVAVLLTALAGRTFRSATHRPHDWYLRAIPSALMVAVLCVLVSRMAHFEPGYLYGVLGGAVFAIGLDRRSEGRAETAVFLGSMALALVAWLAFGPVARSADGADASFGILTADAFLGSLFIGGIEGLLFGMIPLRFLPGYRVKGWSWIVWGVLTAIVLYVFVHVLLLPESGYLGRSTAASVNLTLILFGVFALLSVLFWLWFRMRPDAPAEGESEEPEDQPAVALGDEPAAAREPEVAMAGSAGDAPAPADPVATTTEETRP